MPGGLGPLFVARPEAGLDGIRFVLEPGRGEGAVGSGYLGVEIPAHCIERRVQALAQTVPLRQAHLADPTVLQEAQNSAKKEESAHETPG